MKEYQNFNKSWLYHFDTILKTQLQIWLNKQIKSFIRLADTDQEVPTSPDHPGCNTPGLIWADAQRWMANKNRIFK